MIKECQEVVVQAMRLVPGEEVVFYAFVPENAAADPAGAMRRKGNRCRLAAILWEHLRAQGSSLGERPRFADRAASPLQIVHDALGRPQLLLGEHAGPAISFSQSGGNVWAALASDGSDVGIDVAKNAEFCEGYPVQRVFHDQELTQALNEVNGDMARASALLWSIKEAVAKALGCAFHLADPRDFHVQPEAVGDDGGHAFRVHLSGKALVRYPMAGRQPISVRSVPQADAWLSIALMRFHPSGLRGYPQ